MELVCPICNGLVTYDKNCPYCHEKMEAAAAIQDYFDDYSPYLDKEITAMMDGVSDNQCLHIFYCPKCGKDQRVAIDKILM